MKITQRIMVRTLHPILVVALAFGAGFASSQTFNGNAYLGLGAGASRGGSVESQIRDEFAAYPALGKIDSISSARGSESFKVFGGFQFMPHFAVELSFANLGTFDAKYEFSVNAATRTTSASWNVKALSMDVVGRLPVTKNVNVFGRLGLAQTRMNYAEARTGARIDSFYFNAPSDNRAVPHIGVGVEWNYFAAIALRAEWERFQNIGRTFSFQGEAAERSNGKSSVDTFGLSIHQRF